MDPERSSYRWVLRSAFLWIALIALSAGNLFILLQVCLASPVQDVAVETTEEGRLTRYDFVRLSLSLPNDWMLDRSTVVNSGLRSAGIWEGRCQGTPVLIAVECARSGEWMDGSAAKFCDQRSLHLAERRFELLAGSRAIVSTYRSNHPRHKGTPKLTLWEYQSPAGPVAVLAIFPEGSLPSERAVHSAVSRIRPRIPASSEWLCRCIGSSVSPMRLDLMIRIVIVPVCVANALVANTWSRRSRHNTLRRLGSCLPLRGKYLVVLLTVCWTVVGVAAPLVALAILMR